MRDMDRLLDDWIRQNEPSDEVVRRMKARIFEQVAKNAPVNPQRLISSIFAEAFRCLQAPMVFVPN